MRAVRLCLFTLAMTIFGHAPLAAQQTQPPPGCTSAEHAQFDFWIGTWRVTNPAGVEIGRSTVERVSDGCALLETWAAASGGNGRSLSFHDPDTRTWHQVWMGANGSPLRLEGNPDRPGRMILSGPSRPTAQGAVRNRITWTLLDDGVVEQRWETSGDDGASWQVGFLGLYHRVAEGR